MGWNVSRSKRDISTTYSLVKMHIKQLYMFLLTLKKVKVTLKLLLLFIFLKL